MEEAWEETSRRETVARAAAFTVIGALIATACICVVIRALNVAAGMRPFASRVLGTIASLPPVAGIALIAVIVALVWIGALHELHRRT